MNGVTSISLGLFVLRRLAVSILLVWSVTAVTFVVGFLSPSDPVNSHLGQVAASDPQVVEAFRREWGLDRPLHEQYVSYLGNLIHGDLGRSLTTRQAVGDDLQRFGLATAELALYSGLLGMGTGFVLGVTSAILRNRLVALPVRGLAILLVSFPTMATSLIGLWVVHVQLGWAAGPGRLSALGQEPARVTGFLTVDSAIAGDWGSLLDAARHLVLPSVALGAYGIGLVSRITRSSMIEIMESDYIRTGRSKGLRERSLVGRHALRNAAVPVLTAIGIVYGTLMTGSVLVESIFAWPGLGRYAYQAAVGGDIAALSGVTLVAALSYMVVNVCIDVACFLLDPTLRAS